jgi:aldose 1-epimerase
MLYLQAGEARVQIDEHVGGRIAALQIGELEVLLPRKENPLSWGCYPMAPWASRVRNGRFDHAGNTVQLPLRMPPHAIHGTVFDTSWRVIDSQGTSETQGRSCVLETELGEAWPWQGTARQSFTLSATGLQARLEVHSERDAFPASLGWHPWFRRHLQRGGPVELDFSASSIYLTDEAGIPTGETGPPGSGPFDDTFTGLNRDPVLRWPGALELTLSSNLDHWIVYSLPEDAVCVEAISAPPNVFNLAPTIRSQIVEPEHPLVGEFNWAWQTV